MGIEPTRPAWKAGILPLNYTRMDTAFAVLAYYTAVYSLCQVDISKKHGFFIDLHRLVTAAAISEIFYRPPLAPKRVL